MLERIHIENFKSLKNITVDLQRVNLLIGTNNSGKSNFLKAVNFLTKWFKDYGDFDFLINNFFLHNPKNKFKLIYSTQTDEKDFDGNKQYLDCSLSFNQINRFIAETYHSIGDGYQTNPTLYLIEKESIEHQLNDGIEYVKKLATLIYKNSSQIYQINSSLFSRSYPILPNQDSINEDASNMIGFLDNLRDLYRDNFDLIEDNLNQCIPEFSRIQFENVKPTDEQVKIYGDKTFKRIGLYNSKQKQTYWAEELSEGTLYFLALLCIIHQPNPPKLLLLEEPERGIHPRRIREVLDFIFNLAYEKDIQVIMTTHNERVLNYFEDTPEAVFVFDKDEEGATQIKKLKDIIEESDKEMQEKGLPKIPFTESLGEHWVTGFIGGVPKSIY